MHQEYAIGGGYDQGAGSATGFPQQICRTVSIDAGADFFDFEKFP
jgi:hypothetical protein